MWRPWLDRHASVRRQVERALPRITRITAVSEALRPSIRRAVRRCRCRWTSYLNVVDERSSPRRVRTSRDPNHLLFVGLIRHVKGLDVLVRALGHLLPDYSRPPPHGRGRLVLRAYERDAAEVRRSSRRSGSRIASDSSAKLRRTTSPR